MLLIVACCALSCHISTSWTNVFMQCAHYETTVGLHDIHRVAPKSKPVPTYENIVCIKSY